MKDPFIQFRDQSERMHVDPPANAWRRVRERIQTQRDRRRGLRLRLVAMAAVLLCLIAVSIGLVVFTTDRYGNSTAQYDKSIEELNTSEDSAQSIYDVDRVRMYRTALVVNEN